MIDCSESSFRFTGQQQSPAGLGNEDPWIAPAEVRLPDFIIAGAMKCGTSTVHALLDSHPSVFVPRLEVNFFDVDDLLQHPDFFVPRESHWHWPDMRARRQAMWDWYQSFFQGAPQDCLLGEDSTCYLPSATASRRIARQKKRIKIIVCLRQPTRRAYSQYWHMLRTGRALYGFEKTICVTPHYVIDRSMYLSQVEHLLQHIPRERVYFFVLERFQNERSQVIEELGEFLGLAAERWPPYAAETHSNKGWYPRSVMLHAAKNRLLRVVRTAAAPADLPFIEAAVSKDWIAGSIERASRFFNPCDRTTPPAMSPVTEAFLDSYFESQLDGLNDLVGFDVMNLWFGGRSSGK